MFLNEDKLEGMSLDAKKSSHPIQVVVNTPEDAESIFDAISYNKGASILYMIYGYLGKDVFFKSVREYLKKFRFSNAESKDLWNMMSEVSGLDVAPLIEYWISNSGFPCVDFSLNKEKNCIQISQHQYFSTNEKANPSTKVWPIPINMTLGSSSGKKVNKTFVFNEKSTTIDLPFNSADELNGISLNNGCYAFITYHLDENLRSIIHQNFDFLGSLERSEYINNLTFLVFFILK